MQTFDTLLFQFIMIYSWVDYEDITWDEYVYPQWSVALGWLMTVSVIIGIFGTGIIMIIVYACQGVRHWYTIVPTLGPQCLS